MDTGEISGYSSGNTKYMSRNITVGIWIVAVLAALLLLVRYGGELLRPFLGESSPLPTAPEDGSSAHAAGSPAPYFELSDLSGDRVRISDFANTPVLLTFWATQSTDAADQIKILDDWRTAHGDALPTILSVNSQEDKSVVASFIGRGGYAVPVLLDTEGAVGRAYGIQTLPTSFFVDGEGVIREIYVGIMSQQMIKEKSEQLLR